MQVIFNVRNNTIPNVNEGVSLSDTYEDMSRYNIKYYANTIYIFWLKIISKMNYQILARASLTHSI